MQQPGIPAEKPDRKEAAGGAGEASVLPAASADVPESAAAPKLTTAYYVFGEGVHSGYSMRSVRAGCFAAYLIADETKKRP